MKKTLLYLISAVLLLSLMLPMLSSCSETGGTEGTLESGTLDGSEQLSPEDSVAFPDESSGTETEEITEEPTEKPTEKPTDAPTETETETEAETETEPPVSLKYFSYGNGTCAVSGIGTYTDAYVIIPEKSPSGDIVTSIEDKAFYENKSIKAVQLPSTVMSIGDMAFSGCSSLVYISVDVNNKVFTDQNGILYSKDKTHLMLFPSANPATEISISVAVTRISDMAFASAPNLKYIKYGGSLNDWSKIIVGEKNFALYSASMTFAPTE